LLETKKLHKFRRWIPLQLGNMFRKLSEENLLHKELRSKSNLLRVGSGLYCYGVLDRDYLIWTGLKRFPQTKRNQLCKINNEDKKKGLEDVNGLA